MPGAFRSRSTVAYENVPAAVCPNGGTQCYACAATGYHGKVVAHQVGRHPEFGGFTWRVCRFADEADNRKTRYGSGAT